MLHRAIQCNDCSRLDLEHVVEEIEHPLGPQPLCNCSEVPQIGEQNRDLRLARLHHIGVSQHIFEYAGRKVPAQRSAQPHFLKGGETGSPPRFRE